MAIKEEERGEFAETKVDNGPDTNDVNVRTGMTNSQFDFYQKKEVNGEQEFRDDLYWAIKKGDIERVKELTGWTRDATRPDNAVVPEIAQQTQDNANKDEEERKRQQQLNDANNALANAPAGEEKPTDPLMAFLTDPFGLHNNASTPPKTAYTGNSLEEAIHNGDWAAAARIMNALRAREENEGQDFSGDGYVAGHNNGSGSDQVPGYNVDEYGNWTYDDAYGGQYNEWGYTGPDGSTTSYGGMKVDTQGNITLSNGQAYTSFTGEPMSKEDAVGTAAAQTAILAYDNNISPDALKPDPTKLNKPPAGSAGPSLAALDKDPKHTAMRAEDVNRTALEQTGKTFNHVMDEATRRKIVATRAEVDAAIMAKYGKDPNAKAEIEAAYKTLHGKDNEAREKLYADLLGDKYRADPKKYNHLHMGGAITAQKMDAISSNHHAPVAASPAADTNGNVVPQTTAPVTPDATTNYAWAADEWYFDDTQGQTGFGYKDDTLGYYWAPDGGHWDKWGYNDKNGGYTWDDTKENGKLAGGYQDKNTNYVDKDGNLFLANNYSDKPDRLASEVPPGSTGWKDVLQKAAADGKTFELPPRAEQPAPAAPATAAGTTATAPVSTVTTLTNYSSFMGGLNTFTAPPLATTVAMNSPSNFYDPFALGTSSGSTVWGTKFFDPAAVSATASTTTNNATMTIAPTNPYYKPPAQSVSA